MKKITKILRQGDRDMRYAIITGTSRGLGEALVKGLSKENTTIFALSRTENKKLEEIAYAGGASFTFMKCDMANTSNLDVIIEEIAGKVEPASATEIILINNAGVVAPIGPVIDGDIQETDYAIRVNMMAPMRLSTLFARHFAQLGCSKKIINISSGAARHPYGGWSVYSSTKAAIDAFSKSMAKEQKGAKSPIFITAVAPGVIDTEMQAEIRGAGAEKFSSHKQFVDLKEKGILATADDTAKKIIDNLVEKDFENGSLTDVAKM